MPFMAFQPTFFSHGLSEKKENLILLACEYLNRTNHICFRTKQSEFVVILTLELNMLRKFEAHSAMPIAMAFLSLSKFSVRVFIKHSRLDSLILTFIKA